jgi:hydrogenase/urease accessory protein HupE
LRFHLGGAAPELWVRAAFSDGRQLAGPVSPQSGEFFLFHPDRLPLVRLLLLYGRLGVAHILEGWDHLLFLLGLLLGTSSFRGVALSVTAFTLAHSLSLALLALTSVTVFQPGVEVLIALSLVLVARERWLQKEARPQRSRRDAALAFGFGLVHGLGFGTALRELGVPERALLWALGSFNVGVELGQMACVVAAIPLLELWRHRAAEHVLWRQAPALLVGAAGAYWTLQRAPALWGG